MSWLVVLVGFENKEGGSGCVLEILGCSQILVVKGLLNYVFKKLGFRLA